VFAVGFGEGGYLAGELVKALKEKQDLNITDRYPFHTGAFPAPAGS